VTWTQGIFLLWWKTWARERPELVSALCYQQTACQTAQLAIPPASAVAFGASRRGRLLRARRPYVSTSHFSRVEEPVVDVFFVYPILLLDSQDSSCSCRKVSGAQHQHLTAWPYASLQFADLSVCHRQGSLHSRQRSDTSIQLARLLFWSGGA
jgi:hypothetical protein